MNEMRKGSKTKESNNPRIGAGRGMHCSVCGHYIKNRSHFLQHMQTHTNERPFKCLICKSALRNKSQLVNHLRYVHGPEKRPTRRKKQCIFCLKFIGSCEMFEHLRRHTMEKFSSCSICDKEFVNNKSVALHMKSHLKIQGDPCIFCEKTFSIRASSEDHLRSHIKEKPFFCKECPVSFSQQGNLSAHIRMVHLKERKFECNICGKSFAGTDQDAHIRSHLMEIPFQCQVCGKRLKTKGGLRDHLKVHEKGNLCSFPCSKCNRSYTNIINLHRHQKEVHNTTQCSLCNEKVARNMFMCHIKRHWKEKAFPCTGKICSQGLLTKNESSLHLKSQHSKLRNVSVACVFCTKAFLNRRLLEKHLRSYASPKSFSCKKCSTSFAFYIDLRSHERREHARECTFFCVFCGKVFRSTTEIHLHVATHLNEKPFQCHHCGAKFRSRGEYNKHLKRHLN